MDQHPHPRPIFWLWNEFSPSLQLLLITPLGTTQNFTIAKFSMCLPRATAWPQGQEKLLMSFWCWRIEEVGGGVDISRHKSAIEVSLHTTTEDLFEKTVTSASWHTQYHHRNTPHPPSLTIHTHALPHSHIPTSTIPHITVEELWGGGLNSAHYSTSSRTSLTFPGRLFSMELPLYSVAVPCLAFISYGLWKIAAPKVDLPGPKYVPVCVEQNSEKTLWFLDVFLWFWTVFCDIFNYTISVWILHRQLRTWNIQTCTVLRHEEQLKAPLISSIKLFTIYLEQLGFENSFSNLISKRNIK
jgi:hypothetical protein